MNLIGDIRLIPDTGKLLIVWQEPKDGEAPHSGERFVVGEILYNNEFEQINYFSNDDIKQAKECGFRELDVLAGKEGQKLVHKEISKALEKRVISNERDDFNSYLESYMISPTIKDNLSIFTLLANTGRGKNFGDGYSFFPDISSAKLPFHLTFEIAGHRHSDGMIKILDKVSMRGKTVTFELESNNHFDQSAIRILLDKIGIGYVPKGLSGGLYDFIKHNKISAIIARVNGTNERPILTVLLEVQ